MQSEYEEHDLIRAAQEGDRSAFAHIYEIHAERVYRYLLSRLGTPADAEDITADVFVTAMRTLHSYRIKGSPLIAWLLRIAHNKSVNYLKKVARRREVPLLENAAVKVDPEADMSKKVRRFSRYSRGTSFSRNAATWSRKTSSSGEKAKSMA